MRIDIYVHNHQGLELDLLKAIHKLIKQAMTKVDFDQLRAEINASIANLSADIIRLTDRLAAGLTEAEEATILSEFREVAARLKLVADQTADPANGNV